MCECMRYGWRVSGWLTRVVSVRAGVEATMMARTASAPAIVDHYHIFYRTAWGGVREGGREGGRGKKGHTMSE